MPDPTIPASMPSRIGKALLARLRADTLLAFYFGSRIKVTHNKAVAALGKGVRTAPELWLWEQETNEERLPSGFANLLTSWGLLFVLQQPLSDDESAYWWRTDLVDYTKGILLPDLRDGSGLVADYFERWASIEAADPSPDNSMLRRFVGFTLLTEINETTRAYS